VLFALVLAGTATYLAVREWLWLLGPYDTQVTSDEVKKRLAYLLFSALLILGSYLLGKLTFRTEATRFTRLRAQWAPIYRRITAAGLYFIVVDFFAFGYLVLHRYTHAGWGLFSLEVGQATLALSIVGLATVRALPRWASTNLQVLQRWRIQTSWTDIVTIGVICAVLIVSAAELWIQYSQEDDGLRGPLISTRDWFFLAILLALMIYPLPKHEQFSNGKTSRVRLIRLIRRIGLSLVLGGWLIRMYWEYYETLGGDASGLLNPALVVVLGLIIAAGVLLIWRGRADPGSRSNLGATLLGGVLVALAIFAVQLSTDSRRQRLADQQSVQLTVASRQDLRHFPLANQDLSYMYLRHKNFEGAILRNTKLDGADLSGAILNNAELDGASLASADLTGSRLQRAMLGEVVISGSVSRADFRESQLCGADLSNAQGLDEANLRGARADHSTQWPSGFNPKNAGVTVTERNDEPGSCFLGE
jgi:hypothetical protein